jgi:hypothetical protein
MPLNDSSDHQGENRDSLDESSHPTRPIPWVLRWNLFAPLMIFLGTLFLRLLLLGNPPFTNEGVYVFNADMIWRGERAFPLAPVNFYAPLVRSLAMPSDATPFLQFRIVDALVAGGAAVMMFVFLSRWAESWIAFVMASAWSVASNYPLFIDAGFGNSIMAATLAYLGALSLLSSRSRWAPFWAGLLIPLAVFLREAFLPIVVVSLALAAMLHGRRGLVIHVAGLSVAGGMLLFWLWLFRGPPAEILEYFRVDLPLVYAEVARLMPSVNRWSSLRQALKPTIWLWPPAFLGFGWLLFAGREKRVAKTLAVLLFLPPLPEIFAKLCIHYHWAQLLLGVVFLGTMGLHWLHMLDRSAGRWLTIGGFAGAAWLAGELDSRAVFRAYREGYRLSREFAPVMVWGDWDDPSVNRSYYLTVANYLRQNTTPDDRIVVSGGGQPLLALSRRLPPSATAMDLTFMSLMRYADRRPDVVDMLRRDPPRIVIETLRFPVPLDEFWPDFESRYRLAKTFAPDDKKHYSGFGVRVWELKK